MSVSKVLMSAAIMAATTKPKTPGPANGPGDDHEDLPRRCLHRQESGRDHGAADPAGPTHGHGGQRHEHHRGKQHGFPAIAYGLRAKEAHEDALIDAIESEGSGHRVAPELSHVMELRGVVEARERQTVICRQALPEGFESSQGGDPEA